MNKANEQRRLNEIERGDLVRNTETNRSGVVVGGGRPDACLWVEYADGTRELCRIEVVSLNEKS